MTSRAIFNDFERREIHRALSLAEDLTGQFYCIPGREWPKYPYELETLAEGPGPTLPVFADIVRLVASPAPARRGRVNELYRIRLRDDSILSAVRDRDDGIELYSLLVYIFTHELIHVVRFGAGYAAFHAGPTKRRLEETRVHAITRGVLRPALDAPLQRVVSAYGSEPPEALLADCVSPK